MIALVPSWAERFYWSSSEMASKAERCGLLRMASDYGKEFSSDAFVHIDGTVILA